MLENAYIDENTKSLFAFMVKPTSIRLILSFVF